MRRCRKTSLEIVHNEQHLNGAKRLQAQWMYPKWGNNNLPIEKSGLVKRQTRRNIAQNNAFLHKKASMYTLWQKNAEFFAKVCWFWGVLFDFRGTLAKNRPFFLPKCGVSVRILASRDQFELYGFVRLINFG